MVRMSEDKYRLQTRAIRAGLETDPCYGDVMPPIHISTNYTFEKVGQRRLYDYARSGNPTRALLEDAISELEGGADGVVTSTGMSALTTVFHLLNSGDTIIAPHDCYGGTYRLLQSFHEKGFLNVLFVNQTDLDAVKTAFQENDVKMILIETPSNPLLRISDVEALAKLAKENGAISVADNTFLSPVLQRPFEQGVDIVMHSTTKYINGHSDVVGGALVGRTKEIAEQLQWWGNNLGTTGGVFDSFLTLRGMRTIALRVRQQAENAEKVARFLKTSDKVDVVNYPGLEDHPGHDIAKKQQRGFGSMMSFELKGDLDSVKKLVEELELFSLAESLGGFESLIAHPETMTHAAMDDISRKNAGINSTLLRLSIGLEDADDLIDDLKQALSKI